MKKVLALAFALLIFNLCGQNSFRATDVKNDDGTAILLKWKITDAAPVITIFRDDLKQPLVSDSLSENEFTDTQNIVAGKTYKYVLQAQRADSLTILNSVCQAKAQWYNTSKTSLLIMTIILTLAILYFVYSAKSGKSMYIRRIGGLDAIDEAVGRATEMGQPVLFVPGIGDLDDIQTLSALTILSHIAQKTAEYDTELLVPVCRSMVLSAAREVVKEAHMKAGRADSYKPDSVFYLTDDQFGYVAGIDGIMMREKPAANFYLGSFYAESLILAETGNAAGSIQTAGTAMPSQIPFFVAACDYTLIGEELFAASAYISKSPHEIGSLKGQDFGKMLIIILLVVAISGEIFGFSFIKDFLTVY